jgi:hypothetical protein
MDIHGLRIKIDRALDYIFFASVINNVIDLIQKRRFQNMEATSDSYQMHLKTKSIKTCLLYMLPFAKLIRKLFCRQHRLPPPVETPHSATWDSSPYDSTEWSSSTTSSSEEQEDFGYNECLQWMHNYPTNSGRKSALIEVKVPGRTLNNYQIAPQTLVWDTSTGLFHANIEIGWENDPEVKTIQLSEPGSIHSTDKYIGCVVNERIVSKKIFKIHSQTHFASLSQQSDCAFTLKVLQRMISELLVTP